MRAFTLESNNRGLPDPLQRQRESGCVQAYSVATWVWSEFDEIKPKKGKGLLDHSSIAQSWRGTWGGQSKRRESRARDRAIVQAVGSGRPYREVAREFDLAVSTIHWIVARSVRYTS